MRNLKITTATAAMLGLIAFAGCSPIAPGAKSPDARLSYSLTADRPQVRLNARPGPFGNRVNFDLDITNHSTKDFDGYTTDSAYYHLTVWQNGKQIWQGPPEAADIAIPVHIPAGKTFQITWPITWDIDPATLVEGKIKAVAIFEPTNGEATLELPVTSSPATNPGR